MNIKNLKKRLTEQFCEVHGTITCAAEKMIEEYVFLENLRKETEKSLKENGVRERYKVSAYQSETRENKSLGAMIKIQNQQTKILKALSLLPKAVKKQAEESEDADDESDINDY